MMESNKPDRGLLKKWEEKLKNEGLGKIGGERVPINVETQNFIRTKSSVEETDLLKEAMHSELKDYAILPQTIQSEILEYVKKEKTSGATFTDISNKFKLLVEKAKEKIRAFEAMSSDDSDKERKPESDIEKEKIDREIEELVVPSIDALIKKLEEMHYRNIPNKGEKQPLSDFDEDFNPNKHSVN